MGNRVSPDRLALDSLTHSQALSHPQRRMAPRL